MIISKVNCLCWYLPTISFEPDTSISVDISPEPIFLGSLSLHPVTNPANKNTTKVSVNNFFS